MIRTVLLLLTAMAAMLAIASGVVMATSVNEVEPNDTRATAQSLDKKFSLDDDPNIFDSTGVPHASVQGTGNGTYDWYSFEVPEGSARGSLDIDGADPDWDSYLRLYDSNGNLISRDHNLCSDGNWMAPDMGSEPNPDCFSNTRTRDSFIRQDRMFQGSGTYYVEVSANEQPIPNGLDYVLHVSVQNHPTSSDTTPPETYINSGPGPDVPTNDPTPSFTYSGSDLVTSPSNLQYSYKVDNSPWSDPSTDASATLSSQSDGNHTFYVKAIDEAENEDGTPAERSFTVDVTAPTLSLDLDKDSDSGASDTDNITNVKEPEFKGEAEAGSIVEVLDGSTSLGTVTANIDDPNAASGNKGWSLTVPSTNALTPDGEHTITAKATDAATNTASQDLKVTIDTANPQISFSGLTDGAKYTEGTVLSPTCSADDGSNCAVSDYNTTVGQHTITGEATDAAGNKGTASLSYEVVAAVAPWTHKGFYSPVDMNGTLNIAKAGSTVPFKFEVFDDMTEITDVTKVKVTPQTVTCPDNAPQDAIESYVTGESNLRYDSTSGQFIMNWKAPKAPNTCYKVSMTSEGNPTPTTALVKLK